MGDLSLIVDQADFTLIAIAINKHKHAVAYHDPESPYDLGVKYGLERVFNHLRDINAHADLTHFIFECRGKKEDAELELAFRRVCDGNSLVQERLPFDVRMMPKIANSPGLQLADLIARPIGRHVLDPKQPNRSFDVIRPKFRNKNGYIPGYGLKIFP